LKKYLVVGRENRCILQNSGKGAAHKKRSEKDTFVNSMLFHFTKDLFSEILFSDKLLDYLHVVSEVWGSGA
jgi:hypothetical protein